MGTNQAETSIWMSASYFWVTFILLGNGTLWPDMPIRRLKNTNHCSARMAKLSTSPHVGRGNQNLTSCFVPRAPCCAPKPQDLPDQNSWTSALLPVHNQKEKGARGIWVQPAAPRTRCPKILSKGFGQLWLFFVWSVETECAASCESHHMHLPCKGLNQGQEKTVN